MTIGVIIAVIIIAVGGWAVAIYSSMDYDRMNKDWYDRLQEQNQEWFQHCEELNDSWAADYEGLEDSVREETRKQCYKEFAEQKSAFTIRGRTARIVPLCVQKAVDLWELEKINVAEVRGTMIRSMTETLIQSILNMAIVYQTDDPIWQVRRYYMTVYVAVPDEEEDANEDAKD